MTDLIRRSAANLLAISLTLAADLGDAQENIPVTANQPTADVPASSLPTDEITVELEQK